MIVSLRGGIIGDIENIATEQTLIEWGCLVRDKLVQWLNESNSLTIYCEKAVGLDRLMLKVAYKLQVRFPERVQLVIVGDKKEFDQELARYLSHVTVQDVASAIPDKCMYLWDGQDKSIERLTKDRQRQQLPYWVIHTVECIQYGNELTFDIPLKLPRVKTTTVEKEKKNGCGSCNTTIRQDDVRVEYSEALNLYFCSRSCATTYALTQLQLQKVHPIHFRE